tara:strand:- start:147 stop:284 length:138 start_codon:yes stop_codon:yes gene_type:complete
MHDDKRQNKMKATNVELIRKGSILKLKNGAAKTNKFFVHCLGLQA